MDLLKQLRELVAGVDLSDEEREALDALFTDLEAQHEAQRSQIQEFEDAAREAAESQDVEEDTDEDTEESRESASPDAFVDLGPVVEVFEKFADPIATALRELNEKIDAVVAVATDVDEDVDEDSADAETEERSVDANDVADDNDADDKTDERLDHMERLVRTLEEALPVRRGVVEDAEADGSDEDATSRELEEKLDGVTDPKVRLRETLRAYSNRGGCFEIPT